MPLVPGRAPSREALRVAALRSRARWLILAGIALAIAGAFGSSETSRGAPRLASVLGLFCGVAFAYLGVRWSALLARAQKVLEEPPLELLLTRWRTSYAYTFMWNAVLYSSGSEANPMASLNRNWQWPMPLWWAPRQVPALVYGALSHRGVVVVSADDGFLVARVACSESDGDARWAQHLEWLLKPRSLPGSGR